MTETAGPADPRPQLSSALDQTQRQVEALSADEFGRPTPCSDFDAGTLVAHLIAVLRKLAAVGRGDDAREVADPAPGITTDRGGEFHRARSDLEQVWSADALLDQACTLPWAVMSGREVLDAYTHEFTVHSWDLAKVTGQVDELDPVLGAAALCWFEDNVPASSRGDGGQFGPVVDVDDGADIYSRLAGYVGRPVHV